MWNRVYWIVTSLMVALAIHTAYLLIAPGVALDRSMRKAGIENTRNSFVVLKGDAQQAMFPTYPNSSLFGVCAFDVSKSAVEFVAAVPDGFWTLTIYSRSGEVIYALNSRQSGTNSFTVTLKKAPGLIESITNPATDDPGQFNGWNVSTPDARGIAVLWLPQNDGAERRSATDILAKSACHTVAS